MNDWVVFTAEPAGAAVRLVMMAMIGVYSALLVRLYTAHRVGRMPATAVAGQLCLMAGLLWSQARRLADPEVFPSTLLFVVGVGVCLHATLQTLEVHLFRRDGWVAPLSRAEESRDEIRRIGEVMDARTDEIRVIGETVQAIDEAVNTRGEGATISEDVASIEERGQRDDARRDDDE